MLIRAASTGHQQTLDRIEMVEWRLLEQGLVNSGAETGSHEGLSSVPGGSDSARKGFDLNARGTY